MKETVVLRCSVKNVFLEISQNSQEKNCGRGSFLINLQASACNFIKKKPLPQVFSCEFCETSKITFLHRTPLVAASVRLLFDSYSQPTYWTDDLKGKLNLKNVRAAVILSKRFASDEGVLKELDAIQICVKGKLKAISAYIETLSIPFICPPLPNQNIDFSENSTKHLLRLQLADTYGNNNKPVNILVRLDYL